jgi:hypothetical protein
MSNYECVVTVYLLVAEFWNGGVLWWGFWRSEMKPRLSSQRTSSFDHCHIQHFFRCSLDEIGAIFQRQRLMSLYCKLREVSEFKSPNASCDT